MIDTATDTDIPALAAMLRGLHALHVAQVPARFHGEATEVQLQDWLRETMADGAQVLVYRAGGAPRGYLMWKAQTIPASVLDRPRRRAVLDHIFVLPIWRRRGLASRLVCGFEEVIAGQGFDCWITHVHAFNAASAGLMQNHGARHVLSSFEKPLAQTPASSSRRDTNV